MATKLKAKDPKEATPAKPKMLIFGKAGVGKTWGSLDFPSCYYIDTEGGASLDHYTDKLKRAGGVYMGPEDGSLDFPTVLDQFQALATEKHEYRTLIVDSISKLYNSQIAQDAEKLGTKDAFGASKKPAIAYMRRLVNWTNRLDMNVIFIAHAAAEWGLVNGERQQIGETFDCWDKLEYELHLCVGIVKQGNSRIGKVRKSRLTGFPEAETFEWNYPTFAARYGKDIIESDAKPIELATPEAVADVKRLVSVINVPEATIEKWFTAAGVESFEEMSAEQIKKAVNWLREKVELKAA